MFEQIIKWKKYFDGNEENHTSLNDVILKTWWYPRSEHIYPTICQLYLEKKTRETPSGSDLSDEGVCTYASVNVFARVRARACVMATEVCSGRRMCTSRDEQTGGGGFVVMIELI